jgi:long-chain acyl-CoA synthetase
LQVRSPGVMLGYWNNHKATAEIIGGDGWLGTGDQAHIENNHIYITGRIKDILVLSNGEKVPPADMEMAIAFDPLIEQVMVIGEGRAYLSSLVVLNAEQWPAFAQSCGVDPLAAESLNDKRVTNALLKRITEQLKHFPGYAKIRRVHLSLDAWSVENGLLTPTLKVKRNKVLEKMQSEVKALYR